MAFGGQTECSVDGCEAPIAARGKCRRHYGQWYRREHPEKVREANRRWRERTAGKPPAMERNCELCGEPFKTNRPNQRFCRERHQRIAEKRRYRERHTEIATCKRCGESFERTATSKRLQVYCKPLCERLHRSVTYRQRLDIQANVRRAREIRAWGHPLDDPRTRPPG